MRNKPASAYLPVSEQQKRTLITVYQRTGNMTRAMHEAEMSSSRTAYLWWHRFVEAGEAGLIPRSHARNTQHTIAEGIAGSVRELRRVHPDWGRRRITEAVTSLYGERVISPSGVETVLRRAQLWEVAFEAPDLLDDSTGLTTNWMEYGHLNEKALVSLIQQGLTTGIRGDAESTRRLFQYHLWTPQQDRHALWKLMQRSPEMSKWLLRSRVVLGHSLMNTGRWQQAATILAETLTWMQEHETWLRHQHWEEEGTFNLRWSDAWVESLQYLSIVLQEVDYERAQAYLSTALTGLERQRRPVIPKAPSAMLSNVRRDIVSLKIKSGRVQGREIERELDNIIAGVDPMHLVPGKMAGIAILRAKLSSLRAKAVGTESYNARLHELKQMEQAVEQSLALVLQDPSPMLRANFIADAAWLYQEHGMHLDAQLIRQAVRYCLVYGYRREAGQLLGLAGIGQHLNEADLHRLIHLTANL